jgi:hypothetical protein
MNITTTLARINEKVISGARHGLHTVSFTIDAKYSLATARKYSKRVRIASK